MAIVIAGPAANFLLAILIYWVLFLNGVTGIAPVVGSLLPGSIAETAGIRSGTKLLLLMEGKLQLYKSCIHS